MKSGNSAAALCAVRRWPAILLLSLVLSPAALTGQDRPDEQATGLRRQADEIRASAEELFKLRRIPWTTDVFEGFRMARAENRPVLLYMITGDPLGDC